MIRERGNGVQVAFSNLLSAYLAVGTDEVRRNEVVVRLKKRLEPSDMADFNFEDRDLSKEDSIDETLSSLNTLPFGSDFRLVVLRGCDHLSKDFSEPLIDYLAAPSPTTICLLIADSLAKSTRLYKAVAAIGPKAVIDCSTAKPWKLGPVVSAMAGKRGLTIDAAAAKELVERVGDNTRMLDNELARIASQTGSIHIDYAAVDSIVSRTVGIKPWDVIDALCARDAKTSFDLFSRMPEKDYVWFFSMLVPRIRELLVAKSLASRGQSSLLAKKLKCPDWKVKNHARWAHNFSERELLDLLDSACDVELALKGSADAKVALTLYLGQFVSK